MVRWLEACIVVFRLLTCSLQHKLWLSSNCPVPPSAKSKKDRRRIQSCKKKKRCSPISSLPLFLFNIFSQPQQATTLSFSHTHSHTIAMATEAPNPTDISSLSKDQQLNMHQESVLTDLDISSSARPIVPPHLLARLSQHDSSDL